MPLVLSNLLPRDEDEPINRHHSKPVVAFIIGLSIVLLASILNAAGLNLTKLDHVRTSAIPKASRRKDWLRPLWLLGMILYILSQLIGSTLALDYLRAEYVAPLGSTSLIFNFLFSNFLIGSPVTWNDIYGTVVVILGVIGIVAFGSINSGLATETDANHLTYLWRRGGWLGYFFVMAFALIGTYIFINELEFVLNARSDLSAEPVGTRRSQPAGTSYVAKVRHAIESGLSWVREKLDIWTAPHEDKQIAWTLGIGFACCGGGLAGMCLVFAKAAVGLISGSVSHENTGNQFGHVASIFTFVFLGITAVFQIVCLNRGLKVYDSTLVVPVFYGVYTATGFVNSLIFNDAVDAYESWDLFLIFIAIMILVLGVVLLTLKKPESEGLPTGNAQPGSARAARLRADTIDSKSGDLGTEEEGIALHERRQSEDAWQVGEDDDDEEDNEPGSASDSGNNVRQQIYSGSEGVGLMQDNDDDEDNEGSTDQRLGPSGGFSSGSRLRDHSTEDFGDWHS